MDLKTLSETPSWEWPKSARKTLREALVSRQASISDRLIAAELAGDVVVMNDDLAGALLAIAANNEEPEELRAKAVISLVPVLEMVDTDEFETPELAPISRRTFRQIQTSLHKLCVDTSIPQLVRRRVLESSVRADAPWHREAIRKAYSSGDRDWVLTAVFAMRYVGGFDQSILEALNNTDPEIHYEAVSAAGNWGLDGAWSHVAALVRNAGTPKDLLLAAIEALPYIRAREAGTVLADLLSSEDEEIAEAADEAVSMAETMQDEGDGEDDEGDDPGWIN